MSKQELLSEFIATAEESALVLCLQFIDNALYAIQILDAYPPVIPVTRHTVGKVGKLIILKDLIILRQRICWLEKTLSFSKS